MELEIVIQCGKAAVVATDQEKCNCSDEKYPNSCLKNYAFLRDT
jgi:hypothetical protein